jgi:hypothetical protein
METEEENITIKSNKHTQKAERLGLFLDSSIGGFLIAA